MLGAKKTKGFDQKVKGPTKMQAKKEASVVVEEPLAEDEKEAEVDNAQDP